MAFTDLNKNELLKAANFYKVEVDLNATKANIANALLDAGHTPEDWERDSRANDEGLRAEDEERLPEPEPVDEEPAEEPAEEEPVKAKSNKVLVRFIGGNASYSVGRLSFSRNKPFKVLTEDQFRTLPRDKFREATKAEAREFYGS